MKKSGASRNARGAAARVATVATGPVAKSVGERNDVLEDVFINNNKTVVKSHDSHQIL